jgi:DNA-binding transcriptional ArsR family regulator
MELSKSVTLLASLAQESRLSIFRQLVQAGPGGLTPMHLAVSLDMPAPTLSFHLKELYQAGLIHKQKHGRSINYSANYETMSALIDYLQQNCCGHYPCSSC